MDVYGISRSTIVDLISIFRNTYNDLYICRGNLSEGHPVILASDSLPISEIPPDIIENCLLFINSYQVTNGVRLIKLLRPRGILFIVDPLGNDDIHQWLDNDYTGYRFVHQVITYSHIEEEITPRILWMTRKDAPIEKHSLPNSIKVLSTSNNSCLLM